MRAAHIRRAAIALGALLLLLVLGAVALLATFDPNRYKQLAIDWMKSEHQRTLTIDGPIDLSLFPRVAVKVSRVRLSERGREDQFVSIGEASLAVRVLPLLRKELEISRVSMREVTGNFVRDVAGRRNIDDLVSASAGTDPGAGPAKKTVPAFRFDVNAVEFADLRLHVHDKLNEVEGFVEVASFSSGRLASMAESPVSLRATVQLTQPQSIKVAVNGRATLASDLDKRSIALTGMELDVEAQGAGLKRLALTLSGALAWDGSALHAGPLQLAVKGASVGAFVVSPSTVEVTDMLFNPGSKLLALEAFKLALVGARGPDRFEALIDWPRLAVDSHQLQGSGLSGRFKVIGPMSLTGEFRSATPAGRFDALRLPALDLALTGSSGSRKIDVGLKGDLLLDVGRRGAAMERLDIHVTLADPDVRPLELTLQGSAGASGTTGTWALNGLLNATRFDTEGKMEFDGNVPEVTANATFDELDLNRILAPDKPAPTTSATAPAGTPVSLDGLNAVNGRFTLDAKALAFRQYKVADAKVAAELGGGTLRLTRLTGRAWGGLFEASGSAEAGSRRMTLKLDASGVNVNALLKNVADKDLLEGTGRVVADLRSDGASIGALRSNLSGTTAVQLRDGAIKGINLARALRQAQAALALRQDALTQGSSTEKTDFSELRASARIANGVAHSDDLDVKSPFLRIGGAGRFDIGRGRLDYLARATVTDSALGQGGAGLEALRGVTVPVALAGPFDAIDWKIQWSGVAAAALQNKLKDKLADTLGGKLGLPPAKPDAGSPTPGTPRDLLKDKLKGWLK